MLCLTAAQGQLNSGGVPLALQAEYASLGDSPPAMQVATPTNVPDQQAAAAQHVGGAPMGLVIPHVVNSQAHGRWQTLPDGGQLWRCTIESPSAKGITLYFDQFRLPTGYRLFAYRPDGAEVLGAYTHRNNQPSGRFAIGLIHGSQVVLELYRPPNSTTREALQVSEVGHAYQHVGAFRASQRDFG
ncbi:MAG: hypothetical protein AAGB22_03025, partial [Bacteroidota bacterium]